MSHAEKAMSNKMPASTNFVQTIQYTSAGENAGIIACIQQSMKTFSMVSNMPGMKAKRMIGSNIATRPLLFLLLRKSTAVKKNEV